MNDFEKDPQSKSLDLKDATIGFVMSFFFFLLVFMIATIIKLL